ncbi:MAG: response regulator [Acidobacteria bacterium]|nr:response regulator [Acidobacteriota bacterium]
MNVLYVEGDRAEAELVRDALHKSAPSLRLDHAGTLIEATSLLEGDGVYDVVLSGFRLPDGGWLDLLPHLQNRDPSPAVVVITGSGDEETILPPLKAGADDYIVKRDKYVDRLPVLLDGALRRHRAAGVRSAHPLSVLYVEHNPADIVLTRHHFERHAPRIRLEAVRTPEEALVRCAAPRQAGRPDVLLLDYRLPGTSALEMFRDLRHTLQDETPVVLVIAQGGEDLASQALKLGAADYVLKHPGYLHKLPRVLESAHARVQMMREQEVLREGERRMRELVDTLPDVIFRYRMAPESRFEYISPAVTRATGHAVEEIRADPELLFRLVHPEDQETLAKARRGQIPAGEPFALRWITKPGTIIVTEQRCSLALDGGATPAFINGVARDVTAKREIEELSRITESMNAVARLASVVAHDFNNILTAILGYSHILEAHLGAGHPLVDDVAEIRKAGERGAGITRQLSAFSRRHPVEPQPVDLNALLARLDTALREIAGDQVDLQLRLDPWAEPIMADPGEMEEVITNLATNAREAMPTGGQLTIETRNAPSTDQASSGSVPLASFPGMMLAFSDTGVGMDAVTRSRIFEPFFTTKDKGKGTGLGLTMVYAIVHQCSGHIRVSSEPGHGTTFRIFFPRRAPPQEA